MGKLLARGDYPNWVFDTIFLAPAKKLYMSLKKIATVIAITKSSARSLKKHLYPNFVSAVDDFHLWNIYC